MSEISDAPEADVEAASQGAAAQLADLETRISGAAEANAEKAATTAVDTDPGVSLAEAQKKVAELAAKTAAKVVQQR